MAERRGLEGAKTLNRPPFAEFPTLRTARLVLRELVPSDAADLFVFAGDPEVQRFNAEPLASVEATRNYIIERRRRYLEQQAIVWGMADATTNRVIGSCGFGTYSEWNRCASVGYTLRRDRWGQGLAREAVARLLEYGFGEAALHRIEASTIADNLRSVRLLEALGFRREGVRRQCSLEDDGAFHDVVLYGLLVSEYGGAAPAAAPPAP